MVGDWWRLGLRLLLINPWLRFMVGFVWPAPLFHQKGHDGNNKAGSRNINYCAWKVDVEIVLHGTSQKWLSGNFYGIHIYFRTFSSQNVANHWRFFVGCWFKRDCSVPGQLLGITGAAQNFALPITTFLGLLGVWLATFVFDRCLSAGSRGPGCSLHHLMVIPYEIQWFIIISSIKTRGFWGDTM